MNSLKEISSQKKPSLSLNASVYFDSINSPSSKVPHIKFEEKHQNEENNKINEIEKNKKMSIKNDSATSKINNYKSIMEIKKDPKCFSAEKSPPDISQALNHAKAKRIARPLKNLKEAENLQSFCQCCGFSYLNEEFPLNIHRNELAFLGPGLPLYLEFILLSTIMLILLFLTFGIWALYTNIQRNFDCQNENVIEMQCSDYVLNIISFSSKKTDLKLVMIQNEMCLATTIFLIIVLQYFRIIQQKTEKKCDDTLISPSDYTLLIENITDKEGFDEVELKKTMEKHWNDLTYDILKENNKKTTFWLHYEKHYKKIFLSKFEIVKMVEAFKIDDFISFERKREKLNKKKRKKIWQIKKKLIENNIKNETLISISKKYFETNIIDKFLTNLNLDNLKKEFEEELNIFIKNRKKIQKITKKFSQMKEIEILWKNLQEKTENMVFDKKCPIILVTLNYQERKLWLFFNYNIKNKDAEILSEKYRSAKTKKFCSFFKKCLSSKDGLDIMSFKEKFLSITRAPEPSDILWENLEYSKGERRKFQIYSFLFSCLYLILSFAFLISFIYGNRRLEDYIKGIYKEENKMYLIVISMKLLRFVNSIMIIIVNCIIFLAIEKTSLFEKHKTVTSAQTSFATKFTVAQFLTITLNVVLSGLLTDGYKTWEDDGVVTDIFLICVANLLVTPLQTLLEFSYIEKIFKRKKIIKMQMYSFYNQAEAHYWFEGHQLNLANKYCNIMTTLWFTAFYTPIQPIFPIISALCLFLNYWADKYSLLRRHSRPSLFSSFLNNVMLDFLDLLPVFFSIGNLVFSYLICDLDFTSQIYNIVAIFLGLSNVFYPWKNIYKSIELYIIKKKNSRAKQKQNPDIEKAETYEFKKNYEEARESLIMDYEKTNPITQDQAMVDWYKNLKIKGNVKKVQAVQAYLGTMMRMFKVKGTALKSYAKKKLSQRINKNANCIFQDRAFSQAINWKNGLLQGFVLMKSIKKFKKGAKNAISRNEKLKSILDQKIKNSIDSPQKISPLFDKICSENNLALIIQNLEENEKLQTPQEKEEVNDIFAKVGKWKDEMPSISNSFVKENCKIISILEQMEKVNINSAQDIKLISFIKNKYDENKL